MKYRQLNLNRYRRLVFAWLGICCSVICVCLVSRDWVSIAGRHENRYLARQLGIIGYAVYDLQKIALSAFEKARIDKLDPDPYRSFLEKRRSDRGDFHLEPARKKNVVFIQMESVDGICLYGVHEGESIMPNLRRIADENVSFANTYDATDAGRTSDAEFMVLTSVPPIKGDPVFVNFDLNKIPSLPRVLKDNGYYSFSMHGFNGEFWNRSDAHRSLGFDRDFFLSDFESPEKIGWGVSDEVVLEVALETILRIEQPVFGHIILLTHHHPYNHIGDISGDRKSSIEEDFLVSLRYVDTQIGRFYDSLIASGEMENTIVAVFSDHDSGIADRLMHLLDIENPPFLDTVPLVVTGLDKGNQRIERLSSLQDLPVMILHSLGIQPPSTFVGNSIDSIGESITPASLQMRIENGEPISENTRIDVGILSKLAIWRPDYLEDVR
ncbi:MAG: LTA synthase family protein [Opitutales bacterium]|nr:LTA synthase family protein [Opitutales bacterium]